MRFTSPTTPGRSSGVLAYAGRLARSAGANLLLGALVAAVAQLVLEGARTGWDWDYLLRLADHDLGLMATSASVLLLVVLVLAGLTGRMWIAATVVLGGSALLGVASHLKFVLRQEPVYPRDLAFLATPDFLLTMVEPLVVWLTVLGLVALAASAWAVHRFVFRGRSRPRVALPHWRATTAVARVGVVALGTVLLSSLLQFNHVDNPWRNAYEAAGADWRTASQAGNYRTNGFVGGFLYNLDFPAMERPAGYSRAAMRQIVAKYSGLAQQRYGDRSPSALDDVNVVSVLSETFSDPTRLGGMRLPKDPLPNTRELMQRSPHGLMLSPRIGGGTSGMEFEAITGMSLSQFNSAMDTPYQMLIPQFRQFPSAVEMFNQQGHTTVAIHPYYASMYQRDQVYDILGFDEFVDIDGMRNRSTVGDNPYISDAAAFAETLGTIEAHDEPVFVNLVTMQNHFPYEDKYDDPADVRGVRYDGMLEQYVRGLTHTDQALADLVRRLEASDEKTVLVFYGDHLPGGIPGGVENRTPERVLHETPFLIYANFGDLPAQELPTTSPVFFLPRVLDLAGAPLSPYFTLLRELESYIPAMEQGRMIGPDGREISPEDLSPAAREVLADYRLVQYDLSVGRRYAEEMIYPEPGTEEVRAVDGPRGRGLGAAQ